MSSLKTLVRAAVDHYFEHDGRCRCHICDVVVLFLREYLGMI